jgi:hypothetical protein
VADSPEAQGDHDKDLDGDNNEGKLGGSSGRPRLGQQGAREAEVHHDYHCTEDNEDDRPKVPPSRSR